MREPPRVRRRLFGAAARVFAVAPFLLAAPAAFPAGTEVRRTGDRLSVRANAAPLSEVLELLARETGMKVIWEKNLGRPNVTVDLEDCTPVEAVVALLKGTVFNYALSADASGTQVETLMIVGVPAPALDPGFVRPRQVEGLPSEAPPTEPETPGPDEPRIGRLKSPPAPGAAAVPMPTGPKRPPSRVPVLPEKRP